jgi:acetolactate synthase-1/2/3 large subunit
MNEDARSRLPVSFAPGPGPAPVHTVSDLLVERLRQTGTRRVFGVPGGGTSLDIIESARVRGMDFVLARHECAAVMMAATAADLEDSVGLALSTKGPGLANAVNGIAHAALDRSALALVADGFSDKQRSYVTHQWFDQRALLAPLVNAHSTLAQADTAPAEIDRLITAALAPRRGPVHVELNGPDARAALDPAAAGGGSTAAGSAPRPGLSAPAAALLDQGCEMLRKARRPVLVVGLEARRPAVVDRVRRLADRLGCAVLVTYKAKGVIADESAHYAGIFTGGAAEQPTVASADLIVLIGADPVEFILQPWPYALPVLELGLYRHPVHYLRAEVALHGALEESLDALIAAARGTDWTNAEIGERRAQMKADLAYRGSSQGIDPQQLVTGTLEVCSAHRNAQGLLPRVSVDAGAHMFSATTFWPCSAAQDLLISNGLATMGYALPAAIAAALHERDRPAIAFTGDGGLMMCLGELATAVEERLRAIVIVFNDGALSLIDIKQQSRQLPVAGVRWDRPDFAQVMQGLGGLGLRAATPAELRKAVEQALAADGPALIDAAVDPSGYPAQLRALRG